MRQALVPTRRQFAILYLFKLLGLRRETLGVLLELGGPDVAHRAAALSDSFLEVLPYAGRDQEFLVFRPAVKQLGLADFLIPQWLAMRRAGVLLGGRSIPNMTVDD